MLNRLAIVVIIATALAVAVSQSRAQHNGHPPQDQAIHEQFYSTWMRPDAPDLSCCNKKDCYPVEARFTNGQWFAKRREDGKWLAIPASKIEHNRDSPDGRNHMCAPKPENESWSEGGVFCFSIGGGV